MISHKFAISISKYWPSAQCLTGQSSPGVLLKTILNDCSVTAVGVEHSTVIIGGVNGVAALGKLTGVLEQMVP